MSPPQSNADLYSHIRVVISIIVGLCITTLLGGLARFVQHPRRNKVSILHIGWASSLLLWVIHFWWWEFHLNLVAQWSFEIYFFLILYAILFFFLCKILFPEDIQDYSGYAEYFISRRRWFFGILALAFVADIVDTRLKGTAYLHSFGIEYPGPHRSEPCPVQHRIRLRQPPRTDRSDGAFSLLPRLHDRLPLPLRLITVSIGHSP